MRVSFTGLVLAGVLLVFAACEGGGGNTTGGDAFSGGDAGRDVRDGHAGADADIGPDGRADAGDVRVPGDAPDAADVHLGFDPHHRTEFADAADLLAWAGAEQTPAQVKFTMTRFSSEAPLIYFLDSEFYALHDEWYWFHLLNGEPAPGLDEHAPVEGHSFGTIAEATAFCAGLPPACEALGLSFAGERLYSPDFYDLALRTEPREIGLGSVLHYPANPDRPLPEALWLFELEYQDQADEATIGRFFTLLEESLPADVGGQLRWLARSNGQVRLAEAIRAGGGPYADRVVTYEDLVVAGAAEVYNPGVVAGIVEKVPAGAPVMGLAPDRIVILEDIPDDLPPVAGVVTAVPQTPLAHLNLLAKSRGTPNAFVAGVFEDPRVDTWSRFHVPVAIRATADGVRWKQLTAAEYGHYRELKDGLAARQVEIEQVDLDTAPYVVDLADHGLADVPDLTPLVGGKAAGMAALVESGDFTAPDHPLAITVRAFAEHIAPLEDDIAALLAAPVFRADPRVRLLVLEGEEDFYEAYGDTPTMHGWVDDLLSDPETSAVLVATVANGGLRRRVRDLAVPPALLATLDSALRAHFADFAASQGLRFRSSSTAEDIEGFNGAGLYKSSTGFLDPPPDEHDIAWALKRTWASYWSIEAFEERRLAGIDHLSGRMGVLVHARFDDSHEVVNGVFTVTLRSGARFDEPDGLTMVVNSQEGAVSVTNPDGSAIPEVVEVVDFGYGDGPAITRKQHSTLAPDRWLLDDGQLLDLFEAARPLARRWLDQRNADWSLAKQRSTLVLDLEFRWMEAGWPALASDPPFPRRMIVKQARTLEAPLRVPEPIAAMPFPRDLLAEAVRIDQRICRSAYFDLVTYELYTAEEGGLFHYAREPFNAFVQWNFEQDVPDLGISAGHRVWLDHTQFAYVGHPFMHHGPWDLSCEVAPEFAAEAGFSDFGIYEWGSWDIADGANHFGQDQNEANCGAAALLTTPDDYLRGLFPAPEPGLDE